MKRWLPLLLPMLAVWLVAGVAFVVVREPAPTLEDAVEITWDELDEGLHVVTLEGQALYNPRVVQNYPGTVLQDPRTYYLYGFFPKFDNESRAIQVLVRSTEEPPPRVDVEFRTITGVLSRPSPDEVGWDVEVHFGKNSDYFFSDNLFLLTPLPTGAAD